MFRRARATYLIQRRYTRDKLILLGTAMRPHQATLFEPYTTICTLTVLLFMVVVQLRVRGHVPNMSLDRKAIQTSMLTTLWHGQKVTSPHRPSFSFICSRSRAAAWHARRIQQSFFSFVSYIGFHRCMLENSSRRLLHNAYVPEA